MPPAILISIIGTLFTLLIGLIVYVWLASDRRNEKKWEEFNKIIDGIYSELRNVSKQGHESEKRFMEYQVHAERTYALKEEVREMKKGLRSVRVGE